MGPATCRRGCVNMACTLCGNDDHSRSKCPWTRPLRHPLVSGLHTPENIELRPLDENMRKGNGFWPDMPEVQVEMLA